MSAKTAAVAAALPRVNTSDLLRLFNVRAAKQLAQHFLLSDNLTNKFVKKAGNITGSYVLEVGPGPGSITRSLLNMRPAHLIVIEKDRRFLPILDYLNQVYSGTVGQCSDKEEAMTIFHGDILRFDFENLFPEKLTVPWEDLVLPRAYIVGNLPFNVSTPLLIQWLKMISERKGPWSVGRVPLVLSFQQEVGQRIVAEPGASNFCRLSVMCQNWLLAKELFTINRKSFVPQPEVDASVMKLLPRLTPRCNVPFPLMEKVCRHILHNRQSSCQSNVKRLFPRNVANSMTEILLKAAGVSGQSQSYTLSFEEIGNLAVGYEELCKQFDGLIEFDSRVTTVQMMELGARLSDAMKAV